MKRVRVSHLRAIAAHKKPGYLRECRKEGRPSKDGRWLEFTDESHARLAIAYATTAAPACTWPKTKVPTLAQAVDRIPPANCQLCHQKSAPKAAARPPSS
jgi:hypothetical protein